MIVDLVERVEFCVCCVGWVGSSACCCLLLQLEFSRSSSAKRRVYDFSVDVSIGVQ